MKEFLYVGHYYDKNGNYILKVGTTNNLDRRKQEHTRNYKRVKHFPIADNTEFQYDWHLPLSRANTLRVEGKTKELWKMLGIGEYIPNDRFYCVTKPAEVPVKVRKTYTVIL